MPFPNVEVAVVDFTSRELILNPFEKDEVPVIPTNLNPPPSISIPPEKEEVAEEVTARDVVVAWVELKLDKVVEPRKEEMLFARNDPPVKVNPLEEESPAALIPLEKVEVAEEDTERSPKVLVPVELMPVSPVTIPRLLMLQFLLVRVTVFPSAPNEMFPVAVRSPAVPIPWEKFPNPEVTPVTIWGGE